MTEVDFSQVGTKGKVCASCHQWKLLTAFYARSGVSVVLEAGHVLSECRECLIARGIAAKGIDPAQPRTLAEIYAIRRLASLGIPASPGKLFRRSGVDVVAWGCVRLDVKYAALRTFGGEFTFSLTPRQRERGFAGDVVLLICDYDGAPSPSGAPVSYHYFAPDEPAFFLTDGRRKVAFTYTPRRLAQAKHLATRVALTKPLMDDAEDAVGLIEDVRVRMSSRLVERATA